MAIIVMSELDEGEGSEQETPGTTARAVAILEAQGHDVRLVETWEQTSYVAAANLRGANPGAVIWVEEEHYLGHQHSEDTRGECDDETCNAVRAAIRRAVDEVNA